MEKIKENLESRKEQNLMSFVLMLCFLMLAFSFWGALSSDDITTENSQEIARIIVNHTN